jgi:hypothetical protein
MNGSNLKTSAKISVLSRGSIKRQQRIVLHVQIQLNVFIVNTALHILFFPFGKLQSIIMIQNTWWWLLRMSCSLLEHLQHYYAF